MIKFKKILALLVCIALVFTCGCSLKNKPEGSEESLRLPKPKNEAELNKLIADMTLEEKVLQMFFVTPESITKVARVTAAGEQTKEALKNYPVGGIIYFSENIENPDQVTEMIANSQSYSKIPLFIGVDEEGGLVSRIGSNPNMKFPSYGPMADVGKGGDVTDAYDIGVTLGRELTKLGFNVDFAPVADVIIDPTNTEIGNRSFGTESKAVADMVEQVVLGMEKENVSSVLKHFPGHGSTTGDQYTHNGYTASYRTMEQLKETELEPFKRGIEAGSDFVMVAHVSYENIMKEDVPASLSKEMVTDLLKGELGFEGIAITDAMNMGAIAKVYEPDEAAVMAINAGIDIILMPEDFEKAYKAVVEAVKNGTISEEQINESVKKILELKVNKIW